MINSVTFIAGKFRFLDDFWQRSYVLRHDGLSWFNIFFKFKHVFCNGCEMILLSQDDFSKKLASAVIGVPR